ncbi:MAG: hypothetical protein SV375_00825 [Thermodesulfobacteriota bacterium]|nr:hypothetical protein [Thermodesulfobacteriota bacterium]
MMTFTIAAMSIGISVDDEIHLVDLIAALLIAAATLPGPEESTVELITDRPRGTRAQRVFRQCWADLS